MTARDNSRPWQLATARAHRKDSARARGLHPRQFAPRGPGPQWGPLRTDRAGRRDARSARAHREDSARARGLHPRQFAPRGPGPQWGPFRTDRAGRRDARSACAHRKDSARARRGPSEASVKFFDETFERKIKSKPDYPLKTLYPRAFQTGLNRLIYYDFTTVE